VVLKVAAAKRLETRRKVNTLMQAVVRGVSTWSVVHEYVDGYGAFVAYQADVDALDANILSSFAR
jgi:cytochrome c-type biogenesis protein CcmH/NrfF